MSELDEESYARGQAMAGRQMLDLAMKLMGYDNVHLAALAQLQDAKNAARDLCEELGVEYPGDDMHLADVIEKYIGRSLGER